MNYTNLKQAIQDYTENTETSFVNHLDDFIKQAEQRIYNTVQLPALRRNSTGTTTASNTYVETPSDFLAPYSLAVISSSVYTYLLNKDVNWIREAYNNASTTGLPKYYALFDDDTLLLAPTPDAAYSLELHYYHYPSSIVSQSTTWLGDNYEEVLLYGCIMEAYTYMKGDADLLAVYKGRYDEGIKALKMLGDGKDRRDAYRSGQVRYEVS
jgi:hypothetical protein|tara:strand:+ start:325 stop:957 length:633 start_codon:yes stop_codon:yes gene_type:complete